MIIVHVEDFGSKSVLTTDIKHSIFCWICVYSVIIHVYPETENTLTITYGLDLVYLDFEFQKYKYIFMSNRCVFEHRSQCIIYNFNVIQIIDSVYGLSAYITWLYEYKPCIWAHIYCQECKTYSV